MGEFSFNWQLQQGNTFHQSKNRYTSSYGINTEWSLVCSWNNKNGRPEFLEICRKSTAGDILVSGSFKLMRDKTCLVQRKFTQLIEDGFKNTLIELHLHEFDLSYDNGYYPHMMRNSLSYTVIGTLTTTPGVAHKENAKGVSFDSLLTMASDFERLLDPKASYFSDVHLKCGTVSFSAHKSILSVRSPVFAAMFSTEMKENRENKVNISDISPNVLKTMLIYIYTGKTGELSVQSAGELLFAGDKYELQDLKKVCSDYLKSCVSVDNVLKTLVLGYLHDEKLKAFAIDFICNSCVEFEVIEKTPEWKNLLQKIPSLAMDVLTRLVKSKDEKLKRKQ